MIVSLIELTVRLTHPSTATQPLPLPPNHCHCHPTTATQPPPLPHYHCHCQYHTATATATLPLPLPPNHCHTATATPPSYGYDLLVDSALKPWLIEVNASPSLSADTPQDYVMKFWLLSDMLTVLDVEGVVRAMMCQSIERIKAVRMVPLATR
jgi:hypothetical protein